jgi:hypothetical protein
MRPSAALFSLLASAPLVFADVSFVSPAPGASVPGGTAFTVTWKDSGNAPSIADLTTYQLFLYSGSNAAPQQLYVITATPATFASTGNTATVTIPVGTGGAGTNA